MKETIIFLFLFLAVFGTLLFIFNGRFIYTQIKYATIGPSTDNFEIRNLNSGEIDGDKIPQKLLIPSLGSDAPVVLPESSEEDAIQGALENGVVLWPGSALLGENGTIIILGHSSAYPWYRGKYGSIFSLLNKLQENDEIFIFSEKRKYVYRVVSKEINFPENLNLENQEKEPVLYLLSCWPIKTNWKRVAVKAIYIDKI